MSSFSSWLESKYLEWQMAEGERKSIDEFSKFLGVSRPAVSSWLNGHREPTGWNVDKLAQKLGDEVYEILGLQPPEMLDPQLARLVEAYEQASPEQQAELLQQALRLIGFRPEDELP